MTECKYPNCAVDREDGSKFCSIGHELKYEHLKWDAKEARLDAEREAEENRKDPLEP